MGYLVVAVLAAMMAVAVPAWAAGDSDEAFCPSATETSPGFRGFLPDCRAYELVSPPYKGGQFVARSTEDGQAIAADGEHLVGVVFAGIAGTGNEEQSSDFGAIYEFTRTDAGWVTEALEPSVTESARSNFIAMSTDFSRSLWALSEQAAPNEEVAVVSNYTAAVRETAPGGQVRFTPVGPLQPEPLSAQANGGLVFLGASENLDHMYFTPEFSFDPKYWPGDGTEDEEPSLYEYAGTGNREPVLVGVRNTGPLHGAPHINEGAELVSDCGTLLGNAGKTTYNAISPDAAIVYFTAEHTEGCAGAQPSVSELYARIDNGQADAHTVAISEPTPANCTACNLSAPREAQFEGASADGSEVFFRSEQALLAGAQGSNLYEYNFKAPAGQRVSLVASEAAGVARISESGAKVYFVSHGRLVGTPRGGCLTELTSPELAEEEATLEGRCRAKAGADNLYVYDTASGHTTFIATLAPSDEAAWAEKDERPFQATQDDQFAVFISAAHLTADDQSTVPQLFEYDAQTEQIVRVSRGELGDYPCDATGEVEEGYNCNGNTNAVEDTPKIPEQEYQQRQRPTEPTSSLSVSEDGTVVFTSPDVLTKGAIAGRLIEAESYSENVYEYRNGNVHLISPDDESAPVVIQEPRLLGTDASGRDVFFFTPDSLVPQDTDTQADWYDAREGGGFGEPPSSAACNGESCQGPPNVAPVLAAPGGSENIPGEAAPPAPVVPPEVKAPPQLTGAQKLAAALKRCKEKRNRKPRETCERQAKKRYAPKPKPKANRAKPKLTKAIKTERRGK